MFCSWVSYPGGVFTELISKLPQIPNNPNASDMLACERQLFPSQVNLVCSTAIRSCQQNSSADLLSVIPEILLLVKQIRPTRTKIYNLWTPISIFLEACTLEAVKRIWYSLCDTNVSNHPLILSSSRREGIRVHTSPPQTTHLFW